MADLACSPIFTDPEAAREHLESLRWSVLARVCPHCGECESTSPTASKNAQARPVLLQFLRKDPSRLRSARCSSAPTFRFNKWLLALHLMASSKRASAPISYTACSA